MAKIATKTTAKTIVKAAPKASAKKVAKAAPKASAKASAKMAPKAGSKATVKKVSKKADAEHKALADELSSLIPQMDAEGLSFLIEQANVHLYNMRIAELEESQTRLDSIKAAHGKGAKAKAETAGSDFRIESASNGSTYDLVYNNKWKMFTSEEMLSMVRIVSVKDSVDQVGGRLYRWFMAERMDVIQDIPLGGLADPLLKKLVVKLRTTFTVKGTK